MSESKFIEKRKEYRLPYNEKVIFTDGGRTVTAHAANISRGGVFVTTLDPFPIDAKGYLAFTLPHQSMSLVINAKVAHIVFDRQRCEIECGMGFQFMELTKSQRSILNLHVLNEQTAYLELRDLLRADRPESYAVTRCLKRLPGLIEVDLLALRYRVNRICTLFENSPNTIMGDLQAVAG